MDRISMFLLSLNKYGKALAAQLKSRNVLTEILFSTF